MTTVSPLVAVQNTLEAMADKFKKALPSHIDVNKFISVGKLALYKNPKLLDLDRNSLWQTFLKAAQDGLLLDGREAAAVPYKSQVNYLPMVDGIIKLMHNSGNIKTISVVGMHRFVCLRSKFHSRNIFVSAICQIFLFHFWLSSYRCLFYFIECLKD